MDDKVKVYEYEVVIKDLNTCEAYAIKSMTLDNSKEFVNEILQDGFNRALEKFNLERE